MYDVNFFSLQDSQRLSAPTTYYKNRVVFCNENKDAMFPQKISLRDIINYYKFYPKKSKPKNNIPFARSNFKEVQNMLSMVWLGHSSLFFSFRDITILVDPLFTMHASPISFINKAFKQTKCYKESDFPDILAIIITHSHFDHLDKHSIMSIDYKTKYFICPLKVGKYLQKWGVKEDKIIELDWWNGIKFDCKNTDIKSSGQSTMLKIIATPSQHNSGRTHRINTTLWASFVLEFYTPTYKKVFISGDGGYYEHFKLIGDTFNGFDISCLESGQYNEAWKFSHSFPHEILREARDLQTNMVLPIHWGRFLAGSHGWNEVVQYLFKEFKSLEIPCVVPKIGQIYYIGDNAPNDIWWDFE